MRNRFFIVILLTLISAALGISYGYAYFFKHQRLRLIDRQVNSSARKLIESAQFQKQILTPQFEEGLSQVLGSERIGKVFVVRNLRGEVVHRSENLNVLETDFPTSPEWAYIQTDDQYIRVRNVSLPDGGGLLQVGLVLDRNFIEWRVLDGRVALFVVATVLILFLVSVILTLLLLSPLRSVITFLRDTTTDLSVLKKVNALPPPLLRYTYGVWAKSDEFAELITTIQKLILRINKNYKLSRSWTLQMAHELKTPLAVITAVTETSVRSGEVKAAFSKDILNEVAQMSRTINNFLDWAELENAATQHDVHSLKLGKTLSSITARIEKMEPGRVSLRTAADFSVFASPAHLDQLATNLITNALKYSNDKHVEVFVSENKLSIRDFGSGVPAEVIDRLGEPFNIGPGNSSSMGSGLGLAWVCTISKLYNWNFRIERRDDGTDAVVEFT